MSENVTLFAAFVAGILSFISPCVLPLIPGYVSFVSGVSLDDMRGESAAVSSSRRTRPHHVALLRARLLAGLHRARRDRERARQIPVRPAADPGEDRRRPLDRVRPPHDGRLRIGLLENEKRVQAQRKPAGPLGAMLVGIAFAFGWTPCIGPILGGILAIAGSKDTVLRASKLLAVYSLGLGIPFLLTSLAINQFFAATKRIRKHYHAIELVSGGLLVVIGVLIFTNQFTLIVRYLQPYLPVY